jgi:hypothetical protein
MIKNVFDPDIGVFLPAFFCDNCGKKIDNDGVALWFQRLAGPDTSQYYFAHFRECDDTLTLRLTSQYPRSMGWVDCFHHFDRFLELLGGGIGVAVEPRTPAPYRASIIATSIKP